MDPDSGLTISAGWIAAFTSEGAEYEHPEIEDSDNVFETSEAYLTNLAYFSHRSVRGARAMMGAMDEFSKYGRSPCVPPWLLCLIGANGVNARPLSGAMAMMQSSNLLLYTSTTSYLTNLAQLFLLKFLQSGFIGVYLPLAIIIRSLPFMRPFGGGLLAICIALVVVYPSLLFIESAFWNPWEWIEDSDSWDELQSFVNRVEGSDDALGYGTLFMSGGDWHFDESVEVSDHLFRITSAAFLCSTFLFAFNMLAVSASAALFARLLGAEVDLSRLVQIV
jgi:hypothetical protein